MQLCSGSTVMITVPPVPHLLIFKLWTWTHSGPICALRHKSHSSVGFLPACLLSTLTVPDLLLKPAFPDCLPAFCPQPRTLDFPACCRLFLFWTFLPCPSPGNLTCFRLWLQACWSLFTICAVNKAVLFRSIVLHLVSTLDPDIHKSVCSNLELSKLSHCLN